MLESAPLPPLTPPTRPRKVRPGARIVASVCLVIAILTSVACGPEILKWPDNLAGIGGSDTAASAVATTNDLVFYLDGSQSMKGYLRARAPEGRSDAQGSGATIYSRMLERVHDIATRSHGSAIHVRRVDTTVGRIEGGLAIEQAVSSPDYYSGSDTNLVLAAEEFVKPLPTSKTPPGTSAPPALFHILVTDGVQSDRRGVDPTRFKSALQALLQSGWAGSVLGVRSQFAGSIWPEARPGTRIEWESGNDPSRFRPFYVFVFSPDPARLAAFVGELRKAAGEIAADATGDEAAAGRIVRELQFADRYVSGDAPADLVLPDAASSLLQTAPPEQGPARLTLWMDPSAERYGAQSFAVTFKEVAWTDHARDCLTPADMGALVDWRVTVEKLAGEADRNRHPEITLDGPPSVDGSTLSVKLKAAWPDTAGPPAWGIYRVEGAVTKASLQRKAVPSWILEWSTDDDGVADPEHCTKTYKLARALDALWSSASVPERPLVRAYLRVGPS
jgi:hypothetical protein